MELLRMEMLPLNEELFRKDDRAVLLSGVSPSQYLKLLKN
jgi:hypothetical protein